MRRLSLFLVAVFVVALLVGYAAGANAQTYPPSDTPSLIPPTSGCLDCDTAVTGTDTIGWGVVAGLGLLAIGTTALIVTRKRWSRS